MNGLMDWWVGVRRVHDRWVDGSKNCWVDGRVGKLID